MYSDWIKPVGLFSEESTESIDDDEWTGDDGTCKEFRICLFINGLLLNERWRSGREGSKEEIIIRYV
jgi:hypothetical protein